MYVHSTKKSKLDFGDKLFGQRLKPKPTLNAQDAQHGLVQAVQIEGNPLVVGHTHVSQVGGTNPKKRRSGPAFGRMGLAQPGGFAPQPGGHTPQPGSHAPKPGSHNPQPISHAPSGLGQTALLEGISQDTPRKKRKSGPSYGRMGFSNLQFKGHGQNKGQALVGAQANVESHAQVGGNRPMVSAMVGGRKYTASKLSKKGYRLSQSGHTQDIQVSHAQNIQVSHAQDIQVSGHAQDIQVIGHAQDSQVSGHAQSSYDYSGTCDL